MGSLNANTFIRQYALKRLTCLFVMPLLQINLAEQPLGINDNLILVFIMLKYLVAEIFSNYKVA